MSPANLWRTASPRKTESRQENRNKSPLLHALCCMPDNDDSYRKSHWHGNTPEHHQIKRPTVLSYFREENSRQHFTQLTLPNVDILV